MKLFTQFCGLFSTAIFALFFLMHPVYAASSFNTNSLVSFTLTGITNLTTPGDLTDLEVAGSFALDNGSIVTSSPILLDYIPGSLSSPVNPGNTFSQTFGASGSVSNDNATAYFLATRDPLLSGDPSLANLFLRNNSLTDSYQLGITLDYTLSASASGDVANTDVSLDYYSLNSPSFEGFALAAASAFIAPFGETTSNSVFLSLTLNPGDFEALSADVTINGYIQAASPVPLPAAFWLFFSALLTMPVFRKSTRLNLSTIKAH
ncbi:MAG: hypothetical protein HOP23_02980 [Methylococcaceae bacterium]|nr:hypothetical protein [Methylococcaceae bacterium]